MFSGRSTSNIEDIRKELQEPIIRHHAAVNANNRSALCRPPPWHRPGRESDRRWTARSQSPLRSRPLPRVEPENRAARLGIPIGCTKARERRHNDYLIDNSGARRNSFGFFRRLNDT